MKYPKILAVTKSGQILAVIENLPVSENGYFLDDAQMSAIESALSTAETTQASVTELQAQLTALTTERDAANTALATANETIGTLTTERDNLSAQVKELGGKTDPPGETSRKKDPAPERSKPKRMNSMDQYAADHGIHRIKTA